MSQQISNYIASSVMQQTSNYTFHCLFFHAIKSRNTPRKSHGVRAFCSDDLWPPCRWACWIITLINVVLKQHTVTQLLVLCEISWKTIRQWDVFLDVVAWRKACRKDGVFLPLGTSIRILNTIRECLLRQALLIADTIAHTHG